MRSSAPARVSRIYVTVLTLILTVAVGLAGRAPAATAQPASPSQATIFRATPCPDMAWRYSDPSFTALPGAKAFFGRYEGGLYRMEIPDNWNGELVLAAHGFTSNAGPDGDLLRVGFESPTFNATFTPGVPPEIRGHMIEQGFAWAASSYRCNGYVPGVGLEDTLLLKDVFAQESGGRTPRRTYLMGPSMGGHVTVLGMHEFPTTFDGGLAFCAAGPELFDFYAATGAAAEIITGLRFTSADSLASTTAQMLDLLGRPGAYTDLGRQLASVEINISGGPRPFAAEGLGLDGLRFAANIGGAYLVDTPALLARAASNEQVRYGVNPAFGRLAAVIDATARRTYADQSLRGPSGPYDELKPFSGRIERPLLTLHTTGDLFVPVFLEQVLKRAVDNAGRGDLLVQRLIRAPGHCAFSAPEALQAFDDMVAWVHAGVKPAGENVLGDLSDAGRRFTNPLRPGDPGGLDVVPAPASPAPASAPASRNYTATTAANCGATLSVTGTTIAVSVTPGTSGVFSFRVTNRATRALQTYEGQSALTLPPGSYDIEVSLFSVVGPYSQRDTATFTNVQVP